MKRSWIITAVIFLCLVLVAIGIMTIGGSRVVVVGDTTQNKTSTVTAITVATSTSPNSSSSPNSPSGPIVIKASSTSLVSLDPIDIPTYNAKLLAIANLPVISRKITTTSTLPGSSTIIYKTTVVTSTAQNGWPVKTAPYPDAGTLLPFNRIVAYYGNLYSTQMGVLGQYPAPQMLAMLASTTAQWAAADPSTPVIPALDYIVVAAQADAGSDGKYRLRMPASQVDEILSMAQQINGLVFLDVQVGLSNVETEVPLLEPYLKLPNVELSLDPEFDMHNGARPGTVIGSMDATDINFAAQYLAGLVKQYNLPPKILVIHRFTQDMVTNTQDIQPLPQVQVVMDMDGFGFAAKKINTYEDVIASEPVQFTGFKLFYKNDRLTSSSYLMSPEQVLKLSPQPSYIQYQ